MSEETNIKIYIPNKGSHDYSPAEKYGSLVFVTKGHQNKHALNAMTRQWAVALQDSGPDDLILISGLAQLVAIGSAMFGHLHGCVNLLMWQGRRYIKREALIVQAFEAEGEKEDG